MSEPRPVGSSRGLVASICVASFLVSLDSYIVNISLPTMARDFDTGISSISWVLLAYLLILAGTSMIFGKLADRSGVRPLFLCGFTVFLVSSALCGLSSGLWVLVAGRSLQALGGSMLVVAGYASIPRFLPEDRRGWAFGLIATAGASGVIAGAPIGGIINGMLSWPWIFFLNVPLCVAGLLAAARFVPAEDTGSGQVPFDCAGAIASFLCILGLAWVLSKGNDLGWQSPPILMGLAMALLSLVAFVWRERTCATPLLEARMFANRRFTFTLLAMTAAFAVMGGSNFLLPFYLEGRLGMRPQNVGFVLMVYCVVYVTVAPIAGRVSDRFDPVRMCALAMGAAAATCALFALTLDRGGYVPAVAYLVLLGISFAFFVAPNNHAIMGSVPAADRGAASGVLNMASRMSLVLGISLFQAVYTGLGPHTSASAAMAPEVASAMDVGFRASYGLGAVLCGLAGVASFVASRSRKGAS